MPPILTLTLVYGLPLLLVGLALIVGSLVERRHYASIHRRELATAELPVVSSRGVDPARAVAQARLVGAGVVISHDAFKRLLADLRKIFGGRLGAYETLLDRARREAVLRLKEANPDAHIILNLRLETCVITRVEGRRRGLGAVEVFAYGTAVRYA